MLKLVFGRSGYGKTEYVFDQIKALAENGYDNILLITPEQYSLIAEKRLLSSLGESKMHCVDNSSFSRLSDTIKRIYGGDGLPLLSKGGKVILMAQAIDHVKDELMLFNKKLDSLNFVSSMIKIYDEMRSCNLSASEIYDLSRGIENDILLRKLTDISAIISSYESIINGKYIDGSDELSRLYTKLCDKRYFKGKKIFIDGFNGFVAQEYKLLELMIAEGEEVTVTLCSDYENTENTSSLFAYVNKSADIIKKIALKAGVKTDEIKLVKNYRSKTDALKRSEKYLFDENKTDFSGRFEQDSIFIYSAKNITDECDQVSRQIKALLRKGCKASDIAVITRDINKYRAEIASSFKKYGVPYFNDERQPVNTQPLVAMIKYLLRCVNHSFNADDVISLAKTGLVNMDSSDLNDFENYIYLWNISGAKLTKEFQNSTKGFVREISESDRKALEKINETREALVAPLLAFKNIAKTKNAVSICTGIYNTLIHFGADKRIKEYAQNLYNAGFYALAGEQSRIWDLVMEILNQMAVTVKSQITLKEFDHLFFLIIAAEDLGSLPAGINNVQFGQADRIRTDNPKAVFILGANEGEFPQRANDGGLLSENERRIMLRNDFKLYSYGEILDIQEKYFAYMACCCASEKLFVSFTGNNGKNASPSEIVTELTEIYPDIEISNCNDIADIDLIETEENAFELMSERYFYNDPFYSSLKKYFENSDRFETVKALAENEQELISDRKISTELFDYDMYVSASRVEDYYNCPYRYFCKFGLGARPRIRAEIDPMQRGTLIHYILEKILSTVGSRALSSMSEKKITDLVDKYIKAYFVNDMGNLTDVSKRFKYNYNRLSKLVYSVVIHLSKEFAKSDFEARAFEMSIDKDGEVKPEIITLDDGGTIQIRGSIDRVDTFEKDGETYVRVVDYKSGNKVFALSDILYGLNLQMFIYLFSLCSDEKARLTGTPAGVLYMHSARNIFNFDSKAKASEALESEENDSFKMKGVVLGDNDGEIAEAMEHALEGKYIPVKLGANGKLRGSLISLEELGAIHKKINALIKEMGDELHSGNIPRSPVKNKNHKNTCEYCDYYDVCANKKAIEFNQTEDLSDEDVKKILRKEPDDNATVDKTADECHNS